MNTYNKVHHIFHIRDSTTFEHPKSMTCILQFRDLISLYITPVILSYL